MATSRPIIATFAGKMVNTGKYTLKDAFLVACQYGANPNETILYRESLTKAEIECKIHDLDCRLVELSMSYRNAKPYPKSKTDWGIIHTLDAEIEAVEDKIKRLKHYLDNYDSTIDA